jgi:thiamine-phosphate pyrophosphorylase
LITDRRLCGGTEEMLRRIDAALRGGVDALQVREKDLDGSALRDLAARVLEVCRRHHVPMLINDRIDVALAVDADGVHLPTNSFRVSEARQLLGAGKLIGASAHEAGEIAAAEREGADFAVFGPIFETPSKASYGNPQGLAALREICGATRLPVLAIGGVTAARMQEVRETGAAGVAVIRAVLGAADPLAAARVLAQL